MTEMNSICPDLRLAEAYVPPQKYMKRFEYMDGLYLGTIFPELYHPYVEKE